MLLTEYQEQTAAVEPNHSILLYGPPKGGKTRLVGTAARIPEIKRIFWFDMENGVQTLLKMGLTKEEMAKITLFRLPDVRENPIAITTMLKAFSAKQPVAICDAHGAVNCVHCRKGNAFTGSQFSLGTCTHNDLVVLDSGSQLGESALNAACAGKPVDYKPTFDEFGAAGKYLADICHIVQQSQHTNFVVITHEIALEGDDGKDRLYPLMGTKNFSLRVAKYFGTVVYVHTKLGKHVAGSSSTYRPDVLTGSRVNAKMESAATPDMRTILVEGGIIKCATEKVA